MTKENLKRYRRLLTEVDLLKRQLEKIEPEFVRDSVNGSTSEFPYTVHKVHIEGYDLESYKTKVAKMNRRIVNKMNELVEEKDRLIEFIYGIENSEVRQIFIYKYIDGLTWKEIADNMNYGITAIRNKHRGYINKLKCDTK
ncbi:MAG: RNA polymerase subunit sigma-24 [Clostridium celatum]|nr:RNA polymerase subunit sigma-24 [Clostridium celatum]